VIKARAFESAGLASETATQQFGISQKDWVITDASGTDGDGKRAENAIDEHTNSFYSTLKHNQDTIAFPQQIVIDMGKRQEIKAFSYLPRQDKQSEGTVDRYNFYVSPDGQDWIKVASGEFSNIKSNPIEQTVTLSHVVFARYFKFEAVHVIAGNGITVAELSVY
jgi:alpha-L-fucosidase